MEPTKCKVGVSDGVNCVNKRNQCTFGFREHLLTTLTSEILVYVTDFSCIAGCKCYL